MNARMVLMGGMGYPITETPWGMPRLKTRLEALGVEVLLVSWDARQDAYNFMHGFTGWRGYAGDSLGAGSAGEYPGDVPGTVDFAAGFQPSDYDARTTKDGQGNPIQIIAANIVRAHCVFDPNWIDTLGLGQTQWVEAQGSATKLLVTQHRGAHPDDWGYSQDLIYNEIVGLLPAKTAGLTLASATVAQQAAAWKVIYPWLQSLAAEVPWPMTDQAEAQLADPARQRQIMQKLDEALNAALNVT